MLYRLITIVLAVALFLPISSLSQHTPTPPPGIPKKFNFVTSKGTVVDADIIPINDSAASYTLKKITAQVLKTYIGATGMTYPGAGVPLSTGAAWGSSYTVGTGANNLVQLTAATKYPAVDGSLITGLTKAQVGLSNVENTALSTWAGSANITTLGTISSGSVPFSLLTGVCPATSGSSLLKGDGSGGTAAAGAGDIPDLSTYYISATYTSNIAAAVSAYDAVYMNASGEADPAKGDSATTMPCIGICITSVDDLIIYQVAGRVTNAGWSFTSLGQPVYVSTASAGALTQTPSVTAGHLNQQVGIARAANILEIQLGTPEVVGTVGAAIHAATNKTTPVDADEVGIYDSVSGLLNHVTWANIKATLKIYFDTLYSPAFVSPQSLSDLGFSGTPITITAGENLTIGQVCYKAPNAKYYKAKSGQPATWQADTVYAVGDLVQPTTPTGYFYWCSTAGTSDSSEPSPWGTTLGGSTADNTASWTAVLHGRLPAIVMATTTINADASGLALLGGFLRDDALFDFKTGQPLFVSKATAGAMAHEPVLVSGDEFQKVGQADTADIPFFAPSLDIGVK